MSQVKTCYVPGCKNNDLKMPFKKFVNVPENEAMREKWFAAAGAVNNLPRKAHVYCCEDHFDLEKDLENPIQYKLMGGKLNVRFDAVPCKFDCQLNLNSKLKCETDDGNSGQTFDFNMEVETKLEIDTEEMVEVKLEPAVGLSSNNKDVQEECKWTNETDPLQNEKCDKAVEVQVVPDKRDTGTQCLISSVSGDSSSYLKEIKSVNTTTYENIKDLGLHYTLKIMTLNLKLYTGVSDECSSLINLLTQQRHLLKQDVFLVLRKILLNEPFDVLGNYFALSEKEAYESFSQHIPTIAEALKCFVLPKCKKDVLKNLPIEQRFKNLKVRYVIYCFEIYIEKPLKFKHQRLSWSQNKQDYTIKYVILTSLDGCVCYVSNGYVGSVSFDSLACNSRLDNILLPKNVIIADKQFKNLKECLKLKNISVAPSSLEKESENGMAAGHTMVIAKFKDFKMLHPGSNTSRALVQKLDNAMVIASALINLPSVYSNQ